MNATSAGRRRVRLCGRRSPRRWSGGTRASSSRRATSRGEAGTRLDRLYPRHRVPVELEELDLDRRRHLRRGPGRLSARRRGRFVGELRGRRAVVDISADFRLRDLPATSAPTATTGSGARAEAVYGLTGAPPRGDPRGELVANPGCYPTAALLALAPLAEAGLAEDVVISAASGVSGAGRGRGERRLVRRPWTRTSAPTGRGPPPRARDRPGARGARGSAPLSFVPHLLPLDQGLLASCYVGLTRDVGGEELRSCTGALRRTSRSWSWSTNRPGFATSATRTSAGSTSRSTRRPGARLRRDRQPLEGAAGQAVQNLNLMLGLPETEGLAMTLFSLALGGSRRRGPRSSTPPSWHRDSGPRASPAASSRAAAPTWGCSPATRRGSRSALLLTRNAAAAAPVRVCRTTLDRAGSGPRWSTRDRERRRRRARLPRRAGDARRRGGSPGLDAALGAIAETGRSASRLRSTPSGGASPRRRGPVRARRRGLRARRS